ncbi:hypothetical protein HWV62_3717 [Athelia sp. TMB]|nr:hypothetical protein HWV62_3717 [Athelia sp. TMB]
MQNQIYELAKTLPPPRKQNTACDACRTRKVKCNRLPGNEKVRDNARYPFLHCLSKNYPCTNYVQQATSEKKRGSAITRRPRQLSSTEQRYPSQAASPEYDTRQLAPNSSTPPKRVSPSAEHSGSSTSPPPSGLSSGSFGSIALPHSGAISYDTPTPQLLAYLFSPPSSSVGMNAFASLLNQTPPYAEWGDQAINLQDEKYLNEFALDLVEVFFQIVHLRIPLLNPASFRTRLNLQGNPRSTHSQPLHPALVATVLAWGAKFSEHSLLVADRRRPGGQSLLAKVLVDRARELAESMKVHRVPSTDHVLIALLMEPLQSQNVEDPQGYHGFWLTCAIRHLLHLQINHKSVMINIQDPDERGTMIFAWWMACLADAYGAVYYRRKPLLDDDDYDIDFYTLDPVTSEFLDNSKPSPREQLEFLGYYRASHALARIARQMARLLWKPTTDSDGIPYDELNRYITALSEWRDQYLAKVGLPKNFNTGWDFISVVSSCASDATFQIMWIILFNALDEVGLKEINDMVRSGNSPDSVQCEAIKRQIADEALHGALRIAGLRLDPAVMHVSCIQAGTLLARLGRPEVSNCINAMEQYTPSYEEAGDQGVEMRRIYALARSGEFDFAHMASVAPRVEVSVSDDHRMTIDSPMHMHTNGLSTNLEARPERNDQFRAAANTLLAAQQY